VLATNTSALSVDAMAEGLQRPERFCGMHFFNPVHRMPLVEVVRGPRSSDEAVATVHRLALDLGKVPVVVGDGAGFVVNRILGPYLNEAGWLLADGSKIEEIDGAARDFGMPMGPVRLLDEIGLDIARHAATTLYQAFGERMLPSPPLPALTATERLGKKNGKGFYRYEHGKEKGVDETVYEDLRAALPSGQQDGPDDDEIRRRLVLVMVNEAARILSDRIVLHAGDVDLAMIMGRFPTLPRRSAALRRFLRERGLRPPGGAGRARGPALRARATDPWPPPSSALRRVRGVASARRARAWSPPSRVAGVVPPPGRSLRMGRPKALLAADGRTFLERAARRARRLHRCWSCCASLREALARRVARVV
jgi:hypothetical protein